MQKQSSTSGEWREVTGVICDKKVPVRLKHNIYNYVSVKKPNMTYGTIKKKDEMLMNKIEMLQGIQGVSLRDRIRNEEIIEAATVQPITTHLMQKRLRWYGHVRRRDDTHMTRTALAMEVEGVRPRGRPTLRYLDIIRRDMKKNGLNLSRARNSWYFGSKGYHVFSFTTGILMW